MMEGYKQTEQEDYIWAMRTMTYKESDSELWKTRRSSPLFSTSLPANRLTLKSMEETKVETQTKLMASLVPDEVIYNVDNYKLREYEACFLFGDVSGFTELCEKYSKMGQAGPSRLTQVLNSYIGSMVQEILSYNGDILKFSGDAFLAMWKCTENQTMRDAVRECIDCALVIQKTYGTLLTDVGVVIRVKLAISAGEALFSLIGDRKNSHYVIVGKPIWDVKAGEKKSVAGDIIVSPGAYRYINANEYIAVSMPDGIHLQIKGAGTNWRPLQKNTGQQGRLSIKTMNFERLSVSEDVSISSQETLNNKPANEEFALRPAMDAAVRLNIRKTLRRFIIYSVMKSIDMNEPFEYLTEMRQVVVVFINVVSKKLEMRNYVNLADQIYKIVCNVVDEAKGCVNKVSLFDKDLMLVVIFGLRGLKQETESQIALKCAHECIGTISQLSTVKSTSIGITTGKTYCGVVGHTLRREYTVISLTVNKAARLMVNYQNKVTCDRETFLHSKMEARHFILQDRKALKGISHPGPVYQFQEIETQHAMDKVSVFPILGRDEEIKTFLSLLSDCFLRTKTDDYVENYYKVLLIESEARQGKTRLLEEMIYITPENIYINTFTLNRSDIDIPYKTLRFVFCSPLGLTINSPVSEKEDKLLITLRGMQDSDKLCALNRPFGVNFRKSKTYTSLNVDRQDALLRAMIKELCHRCFSLDWVITIDNVEYVDGESWEVLEILLEMSNVFLIFTKCANKIPHPRSETLLQDRKVKFMSLKGIDKWYHGGLACQILDVSAISPELENAIQIMSNGNPGYIESLLISLIQDDGLIFLQATLNKIEELGLITPPIYMMSRLSPDEIQKWKFVMEEKSSDTPFDHNSSWSRYIDTCRDNFINVAVRATVERNFSKSQFAVCLISPNFNVTDIEPELSVDVIILKIFDSLTSYEQLLVKCSATLGVQFARDMLLFVMSNTNPRLGALAVQKLFEIKVLTCARGDFRDTVNLLHKERLKSPHKGNKPSCECYGHNIDESCYDLPRYASCGYMQFTSDQFREITYNLLTDHQRKEFHFRAMRYLEKETRRCRACGNAFFENLLRPKKEAEMRRGRSMSVSGGSMDDAVSIQRRSSLGRASLSRTERIMLDGSTTSALEIHQKSCKYNHNYFKLEYNVPVGKSVGSCNISTVHEFKQKCL